VILSAVKSGLTWIDLIIHKHEESKTEIYIYGSHETGTSLLLLYRSNHHLTCRTLRQRPTSQQANPCPASFGHDRVTGYEVKPRPEAGQPTDQ